MDKYYFTVKDDGNRNAANYYAEAWAWASCDGAEPQLFLFATSRDHPTPKAALKEISRTVRLIDKFEGEQNG